MLDSHEVRSSYPQWIERFSHDCRKTKTKTITPTNHNRSRQRDEPITIHSNYSKRGKKSRVRGAFGFGFDSHWLKNWRESFKPITKRSIRNHGFTFDFHLKTALNRRFDMPARGYEFCLRMFKSISHTCRSLANK